MKNVLIVGAGASGLAAAVMALRNGHQVTVLEKKEQPGKKLSVTGNGRCNFTNEAMNVSFYRGHDTAFVSALLENYGPKEIIAFFRSLGMLETERNGYYYPANLKAQTVIRALTAEVKALHGNMITGVDVTSVKKDCEGFTVESSGGNYHADMLILSCGSEASVKDPRKFTAYEILRSFGHRVYPVKPVLVPLCGREGFENLWDGIRMTASLTFNGQTEMGELQLTREGLSGIPAFQLSHSVQEALISEKEACVKIDLLPSFQEVELRGMIREIAERSFSDKTAEELLNLWIPGKMIPAILKKARIRPSEMLSGFSEEETERLVKTLKAFSYAVTSAGDLMRAQAVSGGLSTVEITDRCESKLVPGLYITGELLDVDGLCGGYNLHFAFATGLLAGGAE